MKKNEDAIEMLADMLEPAIEIFSDAAVLEGFQGKSPITAAKALLKGHSKEVLAIICALDGIDVSEADYTAVDLLKKVMTIVNDKEIMGFFSQQAQMALENASGTATGDTQGEETE